jgi:O-methyltransferase
MKLTLDGISSEQALRMADGAALAGDAYLANALYNWALKNEQDVRQRYRLRMRMGLFRGRHPALMLRLLRTLEEQRADPSNQVFVGAGMATWLKTIPFMDDERFLALEEKHAALLPIANWHWNLQVVLWAVQQTAAVEGDLVELGVFKGHTTLFTAEYTGFETSAKRWFLYDTFDGIPDDQVRDDWKEVNKTLYKGTYSYEEVVERFAPFPNIQVIRGRVPEILLDNCPEKISFLHIDLNNTPAEIAALDLLIERISPHGILILDDYCWETARPQFEAERRWFAERNLHVLPLPTGQGVFIKT